MCIIVCKLSQNTTLQITHAVKEWDKGIDRDVLLR